MVKKTAVLIDAGFLRTFLPTTVRFKTLANIIEAFALECVSEADGEEIHRVLYYDCKPYEGSGRYKPHPIEGPRAPVSPGRRSFFNATLTSLMSKPYFAVRLGEISFDGWALSESATREIVRQRRPLASGDFIPLLRQKGVELRIGLDVALMAKERLVDRIVVVSGDADIVPAMKLARREGVQVVLVSLNHPIRASLQQHADLYRKVDLRAITARVVADTADEDRIVPET
jgi:uncharacterized LabA/DUF88 family protein